jgi:hypothetical protein
MTMAEQTRITITEPDQDPEVILAPTDGHTLEVVGAPGTLTLTIKGRKPREFPPGTTARTEPVDITAQEVPA